jgi:hypothetical protein
MVLCITLNIEFSYLIEIIESSIELCFANLYVDSIGHCCELQSQELVSNFITTREDNPKTHAPTNAPMDSVPGTSKYVSFRPRILYF